MSKTTLDLSTLPDISDGTHTVKVKAKADGYRDSEFSNEVIYTKAPAGYSGTIKSDANGIYVVDLYGVQGDNWTSLHSRYTLYNQGVHGYPQYILALDKATTNFNVTENTNCTYVEAYTKDYIITPTSDNFIFKVVKK